MNISCRLTKVLFLSLISIGIYSCSSGIDLGAIDDSSMQIDESLVLPVGESELTVKDLFDRIGIPAAIDTSASEIYFKWDYSSVTPITRFTFPSAMQPKVYTYHQDFLKPDDNVIERDEFLDFGYNNGLTLDRVDSLSVNSTKLKLSLVVPDKIKDINPSNVKIQLVLDPKYIKIKDPTVLSFSPNGFGENNVKEVDLMNYVVNFASDNGILSKIPCKMRIVVDNLGQVYNFDASDKFKIIVKFEDINNKAAFGKIDYSDNQDHVSEIPFNISNNLPTAFLRFSDLQMAIKTTTNIGSDFDITLKSFTGIYANTSENVDLGFNDNSALVQRLQGPTRLGTLGTADMPVLNAQNTNLDKLFDKYPYPSKLSYKFTFNNNASTRTSEFTTPDANLRFDVSLKVPVKLKGGSWYLVRDTLQNIDFASAFSNLNSGSLVLKVANALPFRGKFRMIFYDQNNDSIPAMPGSDVEINSTSEAGSITSPYVLSMPQVDAMGDVVSPIGSQTIRIVLDPAQIAVLKRAKFMAYALYLDNQSSSGTFHPTHLTLNNTFNLKMGVYFNKSITLSDK